MSLPDGIVTFLFTDIEGSTRLWEDAPESMMDALRLHDERIDRAVQDHNGVSVKPRGEGDSRFVVFRGASDAVAAAADIQRLLAGVEWPTPRPIRVRASLHTGLAELEMGDYYGSAVNRAARLRAIAHGGQTVLSGATFELAQDRVPEGVTLVDLGSHRLKDLTRPEHVYQLNVDGLGTSFPPLASLDAVSNNIPEQLTEFIGREGELAELAGLLRKTRLLTILAPGGSGKTRLAIQVAADHSSDYADGVFFVPLADISDSDDIAQMIAEILGVALSSGDPVAQLAGYLKSRSMLLVFDNFEHVIDGAGIVTEVLREAPGVNVIVTSRTRLSLQGETIFALRGLASTRAQPETLLQTDGARLFVESAQRARPDLVVQEQDLEPLSRILELTDGLPLAILLAAAWIEILSISEIADELASSLDLLQTSMGDIPERQRSMQAVFDYTWKQLGARERDVFSALSVFRGGFTRQAAAAVAGASLPDLAGLSGRSLITPSEGTRRYGVHELIRQYAERELEKDPHRHGAVLDAHASFFGGLSRDAFALLPSSDQPRMLAMLEADLENVRRAWRHFVTGGDGAGVRDISRPLFYLYEVRGWYQSGAPFFAEGFDSFLEGGGDSETAARALIRAIHSWFLALIGRADDGVREATEAVEDLRRTKEAESLWLALQCLSLALAYSGQDWSHLAEEGLELGETMSGPFWKAAMRNWRAGAASNAGDLELGGDQLVQGREVLEELDEHWYLGLNLGHHATIRARQGDFRGAIDLNRRSVERSEAIGHLRSLHLSLAGLGSAHLELGDLEEAEVAFVQALGIAEKMGLAREMLNVLMQLAKVASASGRIGDAVELLATVVADPMSSSQTVWESRSLHEIASGMMTELEHRLEPDEFASRRAAGTALLYQVVVKELLDAAVS